MTARRSESASCRGELAPHSDLDAVLVHDEEVDLGELATKIWYPLWDSGSALDHSVRSLPEMVSAAEADHRVASGLIDIRHITGNPNLTLRLRTTTLAQWRRGARERLPEVRRSSSNRHRLIGELAHLSVPDVKEAEGGLRDATTLRGLVATWLVDVPHTELEQSLQALLDVRDVVQGVAGRSSDRIVPEMWSDLAVALGLDDERAAQVHVREIGRRITHLSRLAWRRVDGVLARSTSPRTPRRPVLEPLASGVALSSGEVVLDRRAGPAGDATLLLRAATAAAERNVVLPRRPRPVWCVSARRCPSRGPRKRAGCWCGCWLRAEDCSRCGRPWRRPVPPLARFAPPAAATLAPMVVVRPEASEQATVLEVRAADRPGVVYLVCHALARRDVAVRSVHLDTLGPQAVDVFYLQEASAGALSETRAAEAAHAVRAALT